MEEMTRAAAYWLLARVGGAEEVAALRAFDERHRIAGGRSRLCASTEAAGTYGPCETAIEAGRYAISAVAYGSYGPWRVWLRRRQGEGWSAPSMGLRREWMERPVSARLVGRRIQLLGRDRAGGDPWTADFDAVAAIADADGDGATDGVEEAFGTDPPLPDTDGDGRGDAEDPFVRLRLPPLRVGSWMSTCRASTSPRSATRWSWSCTGPAAIDRRHRSGICGSRSGTCGSAARRPLSWWHTTMGEAAGPGNWNCNASGAAGESRGTGSRRCGSRALRRHGAPAWLGTRRSDRSRVVVLGLGGGR